MLDISSESSAKQTIHLKCQALFSLKDNLKTSRMSSAAISLGALRVNIWQYVSIFIRNVAGIYVIIGLIVKKVPYCKCERRRRKVICACSLSLSGPSVSRPSA